MALYFVNYLDRTNLGIAKAEVSADLQTVGDHVRPGIGHLLHRLRPGGGSVQPRPGAVRRPTLAGPHRGLVGHRRGGYRVLAQCPHAAGAAVPARRRRSRPVSGRRLLPEPLVPRRIPGARRRGLHAGRPDRLGGRNAVGRLADSGRARRFRPGRLAVHDDLRRTARGAARRDLLVLAHRRPGRRPLADRRTADLAHRSAGRRRAPRQQHATASRCAAP